LRESHATRESSRGTHSSSLESLSAEASADPLTQPSLQGWPNANWPHAPGVGTEGQLTAGFDRALDFEEFEEPIYRSLHLSNFAASAANFEPDDQEVGHEPPVYRSLGGGLGAHDLDEVAGESDDDADASWLRSMPPLVQRQQAGTLRFDGFGS